MRDVARRIRGYVGSMKVIRTALAPALVFACSAFPAFAEKLSLSEISAYLNGLGTVSADFTQLNDDGSRSTGVLTIKRPGRMRLEYGGQYDPLVLVSGGQVGVFDPGSNEPPTRFPLNQTPLSIILKKNVDLSTAKMVVSHTERNGDTIVRAQDPNHPEYGYIDLIFSDTPILKAWIIKGQDGSTTEMRLTKMRLGGNQPERKFSIRAEAKQRGTPID